MGPIVTVLVRSYNSQDTIARAIQSIIDQTLANEEFSILVVDDGSTDDSISIIKDFDRVHLIESDHGGSLQALNTGLRNVETPYVILLDSDDWFEPTILELMSETMTHHPELDFVYSDYYEISENTKQMVTIGSNIFNTVAAGIMFSMNILKEQGLYDESMIFAEYDLLIKLLPNSKYHYITKPLYNYYRHSNSISADKSFIRKGKEQLYKKYGEHVPIRDY